MSVEKLNRHARQWRSERINLSLTKEENRKLREIAAAEDRDMGYIGAFMIRWGIDMYEQFGGTSIVNLSDMELYKLDQNKAEARFYLNRLKREMGIREARISNVVSNRRSQRKRDLPLTNTVPGLLHKSNSRKSAPPNMPHQREVKGVEC